MSSGLSSLGVSSRKRNALEIIEIETAQEVERKRRKKRYPAAPDTRIAASVKERERLPPPVPKNKSLSEIRAMDPDDPAFKHPQGAKRKHEGKQPEDWKESIRAYQQKKKNERRARVRKWEAETVAAQRTLDQHARKDDKDKDIYDEEKLIAEGILSLDEWDNEELIRGYRRNRDGKFGKPPAFIPREIQQEAFRRLVNRGERTMKEAYTGAIEELVDLARGASSEKVRLDAIRELMNRVVGKVPDKVMVSRDEPWEHVLADSMIPISEAVPLELEATPDGSYALPAYDAGVLSEMGEDAREEEATDDTV